MVVQSFTLALTALSWIIIDCLKKVLEEDGIHIRASMRSDAKVRKNEGMERVKGFIGEPFDTDVEIVENGVKYILVKDGQNELP